MKTHLILSFALGLAFYLPSTNASDLIDVEKRQAIQSLKTTAESGSKTQITNANIRAKVNQLRSDRFLAADTDGNRVLGEEEFWAIPAVQRMGSAKASKAFSSLDLNRDKLITLREFATRLSTLKGRRPATSTVTKLSPAR